MVLPDTHIPEHDPVSLNAVEQYMEDHEWDEMVQLGDLLDLDELSKHNIGNLRIVESKRIRKDLDIAGAILDRWQKKLRKAKITILEGNHDFRMERYIDANPALEGLLEVPNALKLKDRGIRWVPAWSKGQVYDIGKAQFTHGLCTNQYHACKMVREFGSNIFYGHTHDVQMYSQTYRGDDETRVGQSLGCLCKYELSYLRGRPTRWQQAFAIFRFLPSGFFSYSVVRIFNGEFISPEGKVYKGKREG